jgi:hypothetical protein
MVRAARVESRFRMSPELESRIYGSVRRAVMWGEGRDEVFEMLRVNGILGEPAEEMYRRARSERIAQLRTEAIRRAIKGALILAGGIGLFCYFWFGLRAITRNVFVISGLLSAWGLWVFMDGVMAALFAAGKKGSATPDLD